jgi:hypothetical protein
MIVRSFVNGFEVQDWTEELNVIPNAWGTIGNMGIFSEESVAEAVVIFEEIQQNGGLIVDRKRGERASVNGPYVRKLHTFPVPHFPLDDAILPKDIQGKRAYGAQGPETLDAIRARRMERIRRDHAWTLETARAQIITAGTVYAPNGTVSQDWNAEFGVTRLSVDFTFGTTTTEMVKNIEQGIAKIQDNLLGATMTGTVVFCSPLFFSRLISHPTVKTAYQYFSANPNPLRERLGGPTDTHRQFDYAGTTFIEMRDNYNGTQLFPDSTNGQAWMVPRGSDIFKTFFAPCEKFGLVNTLGEQVYMFEYASPKGDKIEIETESNFVNALFRPAVVVNFTSSN